MESPPRPIPGLSRRGQTFYLTVVKPLDLQSGPKDRYAFRGTLSTRHEPEARIKALDIRRDLEAQWEAERERRRPQSTIPATAAIADMLISKLRADVLEADDVNRLAGKPLEHLPFLPDAMRMVEGDVFETVGKVQANVALHAEALQW